MKTTNKEKHFLNLIIEEIKSTIKEGGAQQLIGQYNIQYITEDAEVITALDVIKKYVRRNAEYKYGIEEYRRVLGLIDEATSLMEIVLSKKQKEKKALPDSPWASGDELRRLGEL